MAGQNRSQVGDLYESTVLIVKINEAKNISGPCDPFCVLRIDNKEVARTATVYKTAEPFWGEEYTLHIPTEFQTVAVYMYDQEAFLKGKESIGKVMLDREEIAQQTRGVDKWLPLTRIRKADEVQGEVLVEITLTRDEKDKIHGKIIVLEGRDLAPKDNSGYADPYAKITYKDQKTTTKVIHKTRFPKWYHTFEFTVDGEINEEDAVNITVLDSDKFRKDFMGQINIDLSELELDQNYRTWVRLGHKDPPAENGHKKNDDLGSLRIKVQLHEQRILPSQFYEHFVEFMVRAVREPRLAPTGSEVLIMLEDVMTLDRNTLAHCLVRFYISNGAVIPYLDSLTAREMLSTSQPATIFRSNSLASKSYDQFMKIIAMPYLHDLLRPFIDRIYEDKRIVELDPSQFDKHRNKGFLEGMSPSSNKKRVIENSVSILTTYCTEILDCICKSAEQCPRILRVALRQLWQRVDERFRGHEFKETPYIAISSFIFLRFFVPAILSPKLFSLKEHHPDQRTERTLKLLSKLIQNVGNLTPEVDCKEVFMKPVIPYIKDSLDKVKMYILDLIQIDQRLVREETKLKAGEYLQTLILLRGFLNKRQGHGGMLGNPYKRYYFCLSSVLLMYGKAHDDPNMRSFPVKYISVVEKLDEGAYHKKHMVQVTISPPQAEPEMLYLEAANVNEQNLWVSALRKACLCNRQMDSVFHPGVYKSKAWTCCRSVYKSEMGCSPAHCSVTLGDWRDPLDPDVDAQIVLSQFIQGREQLVSKYLNPKPSTTTTRPNSVVPSLSTVPEDTITPTPRAHTYGQTTADHKSTTDSPLTGSRTAREQTGGKRPVSRSSSTESQTIEFPPFSPETPSSTKVFEYNNPSSGTTDSREVCDDRKASLTSLGSTLSLVSKHIMGRSDSSIRTAELLPKGEETEMFRESCKELLLVVDNLVAKHDELSEYQ